MQRVPSVPPALGWDDHLAALAADLPADLIVGRVARVDRGLVTVLTAAGEVRAAPGEQVAVGDWVGLDPVSRRVDAVLPRRSAITRRDPGRATLGLVVAANVDRVVVAHAVNRPVNQRRLERELVLAWETGARPIAVLTKIDLSRDPEQARLDAEAVAIGVEVVPVSNVTGEGHERLAEVLHAGLTFVVIGASGAGKSSLLNRLAGRDAQRTQAIREADGRGRHTTTASQLVVLPSGAILVDTPGVKGVGLWDAEEGVQQVFADLEELAADCRFADCEHRTEPGCAVRDVVDPERLAGWRKLQRELVRTSGDRTARERAEVQRRWKIIAKAQRYHRPRP